MYNDKTRKKQSACNAVIDSRLRKDKGEERFDLEKKLNKNSAAYRNAAKYFKQPKPSMMRRIAYYGTLLYLYKLPEGEEDPGIMKTIRKEKKNPQFVILMHCSTSRNQKLCPSVQLGGLVTDAIER